MNPVIKVEELSKRYRIGREAHNSLRDAFVARARAPFRFLRNGKYGDRDIWALRNVSFTVPPGEVLGLIGRNGAGKSTLLKILSRITKPTEGRVELHGRVGSLLEVGTGFHSELTGRENVFLNGAILGMSKREIESKFSEIVEFAETGDLLDTPVKHYSSGMIVRLAFAVAAHLDPEILIIDEVLAVGDIAFQKKCLGKMDEVAKGGRTVLFVSHDLNAVNALCSRAILLHEGSLVKDGPTAEVTSYYLDKANRLYSAITWVDFDHQKSSEVKLLSASITQHGAATRAIDCREPFTLTFQYENLVALPEARFFVLIRNARGEVVFGTSNYDASQADEIDGGEGAFVSNITVPGELLKAGTYFGAIGADIKNQRIVFAENDVFDFEVFESGDDTRAERHKRAGLIAPVLKWQTFAVNSKRD